MSRSRHSILCFPVDAYGLGACALLTLLAYFVGVAPMRQKHAELRQRRVEVAQKSQEAADLAATMRALSGRVTDLQRRLAAHAMHLQPAHQLNRRLADVTSAAGECGLNVNDIRPGQPISGARHTLVPIEVAGAGAYLDCVEFLHRFHGKFADSGIASFTLGRNLGDPSGATMFQFKLIWYVEPQAASAQ